MPGTRRLRLEEGQHAVGELAQLKQSRIVRAALALRRLLRPGSKR